MDQAAVLADRLRALPPQELLAVALRAAESNPGVLEAALAADASVVAPRTRSKKKKEKADICAAAPAAEAASAPDKASQPVGRGIDDPTNPIVSMRNRQLAHMSVNRALLVDPLMDWLDLELTAKMATLNHTVRDRIGEWRARQEYVSLRGVDGVAGGTCFTRGPGADDLIAEVVGPVADAALRVVMRSYSNLTTLDLTGCLYSTELLLDLPKVCKKLLRIVDAEFQWNRRNDEYGFTSRARRDFENQHSLLKVERPNIPVRVQFSGFIGDWGNARPRDLVVAMDEDTPILRALRYVVPKHRSQHQTLTYLWDGNRINSKPSRNVTFRDYCMNFAHVVEDFIVNEEKIVIDAFNR